MPFLPFYLLLRVIIVYTAKQSENLRETIDFIQYWYCKNFDETDWNLHISNLQKSGYRSIILQSMTKFDSDGFIKTQSDGNCFPTETVKKLLAVAERLDFGVYLGLAASDLWWKTDLYKEQCERWGKYQLKRQRWYILPRAVTNVLKVFTCRLKYIQILSGMKNIGQKPLMF